MQIAWYDAIVEVPERWEVSRYAIASQVGRLEFSDRTGALGVLSWETCKQRPDETRILTEYHRRYLKEHDKEAFQRFTELRTRVFGAFLTGQPAAGQPCQAVTYVERPSKVLLWSFPCFSTTAFERIWRPILESFQPNDGDWRTWSIFGIRCRLPRAFEVDDVTCRPADVWLAFEQKNVHRINLHRWGLPRELLRGRDLEAFFLNVIRGHEGQVLNSRKETFRGMKSVTVTFEVRGMRGMDRLYGPRWQGTGRIWHDTEEKRLYAWVQAAPAKVSPLSEEAFLAP